ncbi:hypothetical protein [Caldiplasma sukawensis]
MGNVCTMELDPEVLESEERKIPVCVHYLGTKTFLMLELNASMKKSMVDYFIKYRPVKGKSVLLTIKRENKFKYVLSPGIIILNDVKLSSNNL